MATPLRKSCVLFRRIFKQNPEPVGATWTVLKLHYAKKVGPGGVKLPKGMMASAPERKFLEVETDTHRLCSQLVGGNIYKEGSDPELKADSEYPDWLWSLRTERGPPPLEELDQDSWEYWNRLKQEDMKRTAQRLKTQYKYRRF